MFQYDLHKKGTTCRIPHVFGYVLALMLLLAGCENTPKIISSGSSRPFTFTEFYFAPLSYAVLSSPINTLEAQSISRNSNQHIGVYNSQEYTNVVNGVTNVDTNNELFQVIYCPGISKISRRIPNWDWIADPDVLSEDFRRNRAVFLAEKAYARMFSQYCVGATSFYNQNTDESTDFSTTYGALQYLRSEGLTITDGSQSGEYTFLLTQNLEPFENGITELYYALAQKNGPTDNLYYEKLNYTRNTNNNVEIGNSNRLLVDKRITPGELPDFFHQESYVLQRDIQNNLAVGDRYDFIKFKISRYSNFEEENDSEFRVAQRQIVLEGSIIAHPRFGFHVLENDTFGCVKDEVTEISELMNSCADVSNRREGIIKAALSTNFWFSANGTKNDPEDNRGIQCNSIIAKNNAIQCPLIDYLEENDDSLNNLDVPWFDLLRDTPQNFYQTEDPTTFY